MIELYSIAKTHSGLVHHFPIIMEFLVLLASLSLKFVLTLNSEQGDN